MSWSSVDSSKPRSHTWEINMRNFFRVFKLLYGKPVNGTQWKYCFFRKIYLRIKSLTFENANKYERVAYESLNKFIIFYTFSSTSYFSLRVNCVGGVKYSVFYTNNQVRDIRHTENFLNAGGDVKFERCPSVQTHNIKKHGLVIEWLVRKGHLHTWCSWVQIKQTVKTCYHKRCYKIHSDISGPKNTFWHKILKYLCCSQ